MGSDDERDAARALETQRWTLFEARDRNQRLAERRWWRREHNPLRRLARAVLVRARAR